MPEPVSRRHFLQASAVAATAGQPGLRAAPKPVRIGVVGGAFGATFQWHLHPNAKVTAICDLRDDRLARLEQTYRCSNRYKSYREMLRHPELDAVGVFTPAPLHVWMAVEAMKAGKHVISAVPAGLHVEEIEQLLECVRTTGMKYMMAETSYYRPETITCREWAREGKFGTIFYSESEYHHEGLLSLMFDERGFPTWRHGFPPLWYPTHCTGLVLPVIDERFTEVTAMGWGDGHEVLRSNLYKNPFWHGVALFKTARGHASRMSIGWHIAAGGTERGLFYGDRMSYVMARPEGSPNTVVRISKGGETVLDANGYPEGKLTSEPFQQPNHWEKLPEPLRVQTGHGGSHTFLTHEFVSAIGEDRHPSVNVWEAIAYTLPGIVAHQSALKSGETMKIRDYGKAPA